MKTVNTMKRWFPFFLTFAAMTAAPFHAALAADAPSLGTADSFAVLGGSTVTNTGPTIITGDLGVSPGSAVTGFPPGLVVGGTIHAADAVAIGAQSDNTTAYNDLAGQASNFDLTDQDLGGLTLVPGVYTFSTEAQLTGTLTLDAEGDPEAVWVFQIGSTLTTASNSAVTIIDGGQACNVFWQVGSSATLGTNTSFIGNILALTSISLTTDAIMSGRALAQNGAVTMDSNQVAAAVCSGPPITPIPPTLGKAFGPVTIDEGGSSTLTITLSNPDAVVASNASFTDTLPDGVLVAAPPNDINTCGGTLTATAGTSTVSLTGGAIPGNGSCTVSVDVTAQDGGSYVNALAVGALQTSNGSNASPAIATLTVVTPGSDAPTLGKAFDPATVEAGDPATLTITLSNPADVVAGNASFTDTLPIGVVVAATPNVDNTCGGTLTATAGSATVSLTGGLIPASSSCTVSVDVTAQSEGNYVNSMAAGALQTDNGPNAAPAIATLTVIPVGPPVGIPPTLGKVFSPTTITAGGTSTLIIRLRNPNSSAAILTAPLTDTLPSGLLVVAGSARTNCGGTVTVNPSRTTVTLTGGSIPANGACRVRVIVTAKSCQAVGDVVTPQNPSCNFENIMPAGALKTNKGNNATQAVATLTVNKAASVAPKLSKSFSPATINAGGTSTLIISLRNANSSAATLTAPLTDTLPSGVLVVAGSARTNCGGTVTVNKSRTTVTLTGGSIPANGACRVRVVVTAKSCQAAGNAVTPQNPGCKYENKLLVGALKTNKGNNATQAVATLTVKIR